MFESTRNAAPSEGQGHRQSAAPHTAKPAARRAAPDHSASVAPVLLTDVQAAALLGVGKTTFHELRNQPYFPRPVVLGARVVRWSRAELERSIESMPRQEHASEPAQLRRARIEGMKRGGTQ